MNNQTKNTSTNAPEALMLLSSHCAHCPGVLDSLTKLIKKGEIGTLRVINLEQNPDAMQEFKVRSVPWVRIGKHELTGAQTLEALQQRAQWALTDLTNQAKQGNQNDQESDNNPLADFDFLLSEGQVSKVVESIQEDESKIETIMELLGDSGTVLSTRIGIGVIFEEFAGNKLIKSLVPQLEKLTQHDDVRIRADAYHYLGMSADKRAIAILESGKDDKDQEVRGIVADSLEELQSL